MLSPIGEEAPEVGRQELAETEYASLHSLLPVNPVARTACL